MNSNKTIANNNSFTLKFTNTTNELKKVILFEQGSSSAFTLNKVRSAVANGSQGTLLLNPIVWNFSAGQPFGYPSPALSSLIPSNYNISDFRLRTTNTLVIVVDLGAVLTSINVPLTINMTINEVNEAIYNEIRTIPFDEVRSPSGEFLEINVVIDQNYWSNLTFPLNMTFSTTYKGWGVSVQYPFDMPSTTKVNSMKFNPVSVFPEFDNIKGIPQVITSSANGVLVDDTASNVSYLEIERSQSGGVYDIQSMSLDVGKTPSQNEADGQMLQPLCYQKRDVNGNVMEYCKVPTKDPYQFQNSYSVLEMSTDSDNYVLDGNTEFVYRVEPSTSAILTFNYVKLTNLVADTNLGIAKMEADKKKLETIDAQKTTKRTIELTTTQQSKKGKRKVVKSKPTKKISNFINNIDIKSAPTKKTIGVLLGVGVFFFFFYKLNQTK